MFTEDLEFHPGLRPDGIWPTSSLDSSGMLARYSTVSVAEAEDNFGDVSGGG